MSIKDQIRKRLNESIYDKEAIKAVAKAYDLTEEEADKELNRGSYSAAEVKRAISQYKNSQLKEESLGLTNYPIEYDYRYETDDVVDYFKGHLTVKATSEDEAIEKAKAYLNSREYERRSPDQYDPHNIIIGTQFYSNVPVIEQIAQTDDPKEKEALTKYRDELLDQAEDADDHNNPWKATNYRAKAEDLDESGEESTKDTYQMGEDNILYMNEAQASEYILSQADESKIKELEKGSAFTWEGMNTDEDNLEAIVEFFKEKTPNIKLPIKFYTWSGELFNKIYKLTGDNAYPNDLTFLSISLDNWDGLGSLPMIKFQVGARWLDDIVDNNARRQGYEEDEDESLEEDEIVDRLDKNSISTYLNKHLMNGVKVADIETNRGRGFKTFIIYLTPDEYNNDGYGYSFDYIPKSSGSPRDFISYMTDTLNDNIKDVDESLEEDTLDDAGVSTITVDKLVNSGEANTKFRIKNHIVKGKDLVDYFDEDEVLTIAYTPGEIPEIIDRSSLKEDFMSFGEFCDKYDPDCNLSDEELEALYDLALKAHDPDEELGESYAIVQFYNDKGDAEEKIINGSSPKDIENKVKRLADRYEIVEISQVSSDVKDSEYLNTLGRGIRRIDLINTRFTEAAEDFYTQKFIIPYRAEIQGDDGDEMHQYPPQCDYVDQIVSSAIEDWNDSEMQKYMPEDILAVSTNMHPTDDYTKVMIEIKTKVELTDEQLDDLKDWLTGQMSDGWGEGFEQREVDSYTETDYHTEYDDENEEEYEVEDEIGYYVYGQFWWHDDRHPWEITLYDKNAR